MVYQPAIGTALLLPILEAVVDLHLESFAILPRMRFELSDFLICNEEQTRLLGRAGCSTVNYEWKAAAGERLTAVIREVNFPVNSPTLLEHLTPLNGELFPASLRLGCDFLAQTDNHCVEVIFLSSEKLIGGFDKKKNLWSERVQDNVSGDGPFMLLGTCQVLTQSVPICSVLESTSDLLA